MKKFIQMTLLTIVLNLISAFFVVNFTNEIPKSINPNDYSTSKYFFEIVVGVLFAPYIETWILYFGVKSSTSLFNRSNLLTVFVGALPLIFLHGLISLSKVVAIASGFFVQAYYLNNLLKENCSLKETIQVVFLIHAINNALAYLAGYAFGKLEI